MRSAIARKLVATGFHPTFGIHHDSQLNPFNLADDLIEPYRAMVDLVAHENIMTAIDIMVESLKRIILDNSSEELKLPVVIPVESMEGITE